MTTSIILVVISAVVALIAIKLLLDIKKISNDGVEVKGIIFDLEQGAGSNNNISYPIVRFLTTKNEWITKTSKTSGLPGTYKKGQEITIVYQTNNPNNFYIKNNFTYLIPVIMIIITSALMAYGIYLPIQG